MVPTMHLLMTALALALIIPVSAQGSGEALVPPSAARMQALEACAISQMAAPVDEGGYQARAAMPSPIQTQVEVNMLDSFSFTVIPSSVRMEVGMLMHLVFMWRDDRLYDESRSCDQLLFPSLVQQVNGDFRTLAPDGRVSLQVGPSGPMYVGNRVRSLPAGLWVCEYRVRVTTRMGWHYESYPFDQQNVTAFLFVKHPELRVANWGPAAFSTFSFDTNTAHRANATDRAAVDAARAFLLPQQWDLDIGHSGREPWLLAADPHTNTPAMAAWLGTTCPFTIRLRRNPMVYIVKSIVLDVLIVIAGISAILINPAVPPQLGARLGLMMTSMLMTINKSARRDLGLGPIGYLMKLDYLAIVNIIILLVMLLETLVVHFLLGRKMSNLAGLVDTAFRVAAPILYLLTLAGFVLAFVADAHAIIIYVLVVLVALTSSFALFIGLTMQRRRLRLEVRAAKLIADGVLSEDSDVRNMALAQVCDASPPCDLFRARHTP